MLERKRQLLDQYAEEVSSMSESISDVICKMKEKYQTFTDLREYYMYELGELEDKLAVSTLASSTGIPPKSRLLGKCRAF